MELSSMLYSSVHCNVVADCYYCTMAACATGSARTRTGDERMVRDRKGESSYSGVHECGWTDLCVPPEELRPAVTLTIGQAFNWRRVSDDTWVGALGSYVLAIRYEVLQQSQCCIIHKLTRSGQDTNWLIEGLDSLGGGV